MAAENPTNDDSLKQSDREHSINSILTYESDFSGTANSNIETDDNNDVLTEVVETTIANAIFTVTSSHKVQQQGQTETVTQTDAVIEKEQQGDQNGTVALDDKNQIHSNLNDSKDQDEVLGVSQQQSNPVDVDIDTLDLNAHLNRLTRKVTSQDLDQFKKDSEQEDNDLNDENKEYEDDFESNRSPGATANDCDDLPAAKESDIGIEIQTDQQKLDTDNDQKQELVSSDQQKVTYADKDEVALIQDSEDNFKQRPSRKSTQSQSLDQQTHESDEKQLQFVPKASQSDLNQSYLNSSLSSVDPNLLESLIIKTANAAPIENRRNQTAIRTQSNNVINSNSNSKIKSQQQTGSNEQTGSYQPNNQSDSSNLDATQNLNEPSKRGQSSSMIPPRDPHERPLAPQDRSVIKQEDLVTHDDDWFLNATSAEADESEFNKSPEPGPAQTQYKENSECDILSTTNSNQFPDASHGSTNQQSDMIMIHNGGPGPLPGQLQLLQAQRGDHISQPRYQISGGIGPTGPGPTTISDIYYDSVSSDDFDENGNLVDTMAGQKQRFFPPLVPLEENQVLDRENLSKRMNKKITDLKFLAKHLKSAQKLYEKELYSLHQLEVEYHRRAFPEDDHLEGTIKLPKIKGAKNSSSSKNSLRSPIQNKARNLAKRGQQLPACLTGEAHPEYRPKKPLSPVIKTADRSVAVTQLSNRRQSGPGPRSESQNNSTLSNERSSTMLSLNTTVAHGGSLQNQTYQSQNQYIDQQSSLLNHHQILNQTQQQHHHHHHHGSHSSSSQILSTQQSTQYQQQGPGLGTGTKTSPINTSASCSPILKSSEGGGPGTQQDSPSRE